MERAPKRIRLVCSCGRKTDDEIRCSICTIVSKGKQLRAAGWNYCRLRRIDKHWLNTACDVLDVAKDDLFNVIAFKIYDADDEETDVVANFVIMCYRMRHSAFGKKVYDRCLTRFQKRCSPVVVIASTWRGKPLENAETVVREVIAEHRRRGRPYGHILDTYPHIGIKV